MDFLEVCNVLFKISVAIFMAGNLLEMGLKLNLSDALKGLKNIPFFIEEVFYSKNVKSAIRIGEGRGIVFLCAASARIPITEYAATVIKKAVVGNGIAQKEQVQEMVKIILDLTEIPEPKDASDALAIAICHSHSL